jgi:3-oxoacyl-[acyl-carrier-protein] synthase-3
MEKRYKASITGIGSFLPKKILTNADLVKMLDTTDEWITKLDDAKVLPSEVDLIITSTITPDCLFPSTSCFIQEKIGANNAGAFDILAACAGFIYALSIAKNFIISGSTKTVLVVGAECLSKITDYTDRSTCILFGDGAGATVVQRSNGKREIITTHLYADGRQADILTLPAGGSKLPTSHETVDSRSHYIQLKGKEVFKIAVTNMIDVITKTVSENNMKIEDIDLIVPHQSNIRIIEAAMEKLNLPKEKAFVNIDRYGNTSSASIPIAIDEVEKAKMLKSGNTVLLVAFGGGLTWSSSIIKW